MEVKQDFNLERHTKRLVTEALQRANGDTDSAARLLGIVRQTLRIWIDRYDITEVEAKALETSPSEDLNVSRAKKRLFMKAYSETNGNRQETARLLGVTVTTVFLWIRKYNFEVKSA